MRKIDEKSFIQGIAYSAALLIRDWDQPTIGLEIITTSNLTLEDLLKADVDVYDLHPIKKAGLK